MIDPDLKKLSVQTYWDARPCGELEVGRHLSSPEAFEAHAQLRYRREPEIHAFAEFQSWKGRRVLEIGAGLGADLVRFAKAGAEAVGVDLSLRSVALAAQNARLNQVAPALLSTDAEWLPFRSGSFDLVYSWGVIHHTPDIAQAIEEIHRVLKPDGECRAMLYHRQSLLALQCYLRYGVGRARPWASVSRLIADHIESPGTRAFSVTEVRRLFRRFEELSIQPVVTAYDLRVARRRFAPRWLRCLVPSGVGWFLLIRARKQ